MQKPNIKLFNRMMQNLGGSGIYSNTIGDSSTESFYDFSDELNESAHVHEYFIKETIDNDIVGIEVHIIFSLINLHFYV